MLVRCLAAPARRAATRRIMHHEGEDTRMPRKLIALIALFALSCRGKPQPSGTETKTQPMRASPHAEDGRTQPAATKRPEFSTRRKSVPVAKILYSREFHADAVGKEAEDLFTINGEFLVQKLAGHNVLALKPTPLDTFQLIFGPAATENVAVEAHVFGRKKGRRKPMMGIGVGGISGPLLRLNPQARAIELVQNDDVLARANFPWKSATWYVMRLEVQKLRDKTSAVRGKVWEASKTEPAEWSIEHTLTEKLPSGRPSLYGVPYSGKPLYFDKLRVRRLPVREWK